MFTFEEIREIINLINQSSIQHFELEHETTKIAISKVLPNAGEGIPVPNTMVSDVVIGSRTNVALEEKKNQILVKEDKEENLYKIVSPTVGTFYSASEPGAVPFVTIGEEIHSNTIVCVLEAMKLFNEVEAGVTGKIVEILVQEGDFIEYGQPLFLVKTAS